METKTEKNLKAAFAGESQARNKYTYFAKAARKEGYRYILNTISSEFFETNPNTGIPDAFVGFWSKWYKISI